MAMTLPARRLAARHDAQSRVPRYLQVASALRRRIRDGIWPVGTKIATIEELEREFRVARVTVRQAIELLQTEGLVKPVQGRGTFVIKSIENDRWLQLATDWDSLIAPIRDNVPHILSSDERHLPALRDGDGTPAATYHYICSVQKRAGKPYAYARVYLARQIYEMAPKPFRSRVALAVLSELKGVSIARAHQTIEIGAADIEAARRLGIVLNAPTAEARCVVTDEAGVVIYVGEITYPGDCVRLNIELIGDSRAPDAR
jgi:GntR family transcriptional regulator